MDSVYPEAAVVLRGQAQSDKSIAAVPTIRANGSNRNFVFSDINEMEREIFRILDRFLDFDFDAIFLLSCHGLPIGPGCLLLR